LNVGSPKLELSADYDENVGHSKNGSLDNRKRLFDNIRLVARRAGYAGADAADLAAAYVHATVAR
jgi:hypothetical protein